MTERKDDEYPELGDVIYEDTCRAEIRIIGVNKLGFMTQFPPHNWGWVLLKEVKTLGEVRMLAEALGYKFIQ